MRKLALIVLFAGTALATPAGAATFAVAVGSPVGGPSCGSANSNGTAPTSREIACDSLYGFAAADYGHVGGRTAANVGSGYFGTAFGIGSQSIFTDLVTFTSTDPNLTHAAVAANLAFSGTMNSTGAATASVDLNYTISGGGGFLFSATDDYGIARNDFGLTSGSLSAALTSALLRTGTFMVPLNTPLLLIMSLSTGAGVGGSGSPESASSNFSNSFDVPLGMDAFVLPEGVTANAGTWLVNNRRVGPAATAVPEPASWALMLLGFGAAGHLIRRRRAARLAAA
jgi:hypothetical protein